MPERIAQVIPLRPGRHAGPAKRPYTRLPDDSRHRLVAGLLDQDRRRPLTLADYDRAAARYGVSRRSAQLWVAQARANAARGGDPVPAPRAPQTSKIVISDEVLACHIGVNVTKGMLRALARGLIPECSLSAYRDQLYRHAGADVIAGLQGGLRMLPEQWVFLDRRAVPLLHHYTVDLFFPRVACLSDDGSRVLDPVWAAVRERATGVILAHHLWPDRAGLDHVQVAALVARAIRGFVYDGTFVGGVAEGLRCDREAIFLKKELRVGLMSLGMQIDPTNSYSSWENGAHERMHEVIRAEALQGVLASTDGPQLRSKQLVFAGQTMSYTDLRGRLARWAHAYTFQRPQDVLDGLTPFLRWRELAARHGALPVADEAALAELSVSAGEAVRTKQGVRFGNRFFIGSTLIGSRRKLRVGTWPGEEDLIEAFDPADGRWVGTLVERSTAPAVVEAAVIHARARSQRTVAALAERAKREAFIEAGETPPRPRPDLAGLGHSAADEGAVDPAADRGTAGPASDGTLLERLTTLNAPDAGSED